MVMDGLLNDRFRLLDWFLGISVARSFAHITVATSNLTNESSVFRFCQQDNHRSDENHDRESHRLYMRSEKITHDRLF